MQTGPFEPDPVCTGVGKGTSPILVLERIHLSSLNTESQTANIEILNEE